SIAYLYSFRIQGKGALVFRTDKSEKAREAILREGLTLIGDAVVNAGTIPVNGEYQHTWNYTIDETSYEDRTFVIRVYFGCDGQDEGYAEWTLFVPGIELVPPTINVARAELRTRETEDNKADLRFIFNVTFNDGFINHAGATYGPGAAYEITDFYSVVSVLGNTAVVPGNNIFEMHDDYYFFTAVVKGIRPNYFGTRVNATGYLEYVEVATGIEGADDTTDQIFSFCINDLL
ncbi:MAG: hypothetical protein J6P98_01570, partial [Clostridia bacterium]|nr:hypothetical protein [Clostridia bacterium]